MRTAFIFAVIGYLGLVRLQINLHKRRKLSEGIFVLFQLALWSLMILTGVLAFSTDSVSVLVAVILSVLCWVVGYPVGKRVYRYYFAQRRND